MEPVSISIALGLAQFAPSIMRFFGAGEKPIAAAEKIVGIAQTVTGATSPQDALDRLRQSAELANQFNLAVLAADTELEKAALADRDSARDRDVEIRKLNGGENLRADVMVAAAAIGLIACLLTLIFFRGQIPGEAVGIISTIAGIFGACLKDAYQFEFGSSRGSKHKDAIIGEIARMP